MSGAEEGSSVFGSWLKTLGLFIPLFTAVLALLQAVAIQNANQAFSHQEAATAFLERRLDEVYVPISARLTTTGDLFRRFNERSTTAAEKTAIEHEMHEHNAAVAQLLTAKSALLGPGSDTSVACPDTLISELLTHLAQWETVYKLKYEYETWTGPVFAGIQEFNYRGFPSGSPCGGADSYFTEGVRELRAKLHAARAAGPRVGLLTRLLTSR